MIFLSPQTSYENGHSHSFKINLLGNGVSTGIIPAEYEDGHSHLILDFLVLPAGEDKHIHQIGG